MTTNAKIPQINITLDPAENAPNNIGETLTDVEDLVESEPAKTKSKLKIKLIDEGAVTDLEDLEASDLEDEANVKSVSLNDLHLDTFNTEETVLTDNHDRIEGNLQKFSQNYKELDVPKLSPDEGLTDAENFETDNESESVELPEPEVNFDDYYIDSVQFSSDLKSPHSSKIPHSSLTLPKVEASELTDLESLSSDSEKKCLIKKNKIKRRKGKCNNRHESDGEDEKKWRRCTRMKKSLSHPASLNHQQGYTVFESDGEDEEKCFLKFPLCKKVVKKQNYGLTDTEELEEIPRSGKKFIGVKEKQKLIRSEEDYSSSGTSEEILDGDLEQVNIMDLILPPPVRTLILLHEDKSLIPTAKIVPLKELGTLGYTFRIEEGATTDIEFFNDDDFLDVETINRGPTPEIHGFENSTTTYGESKLSVKTQTGLEPLTDTEDISVTDSSKKAKKLKNKTLQVVVSAEPPTTDTEDFYLSDSNKSPLKRQTDIEDFTTDDDEELSVGNSTFYIGGIATNITARDSDGISTTKNHLNVSQKGSNLAANSNLTDVEDLVASADEEVTVRARTDTPNEFLKHLEQQRSSKVYIESSKKIDLDNPTEIMYLKGGCYVQNHTDVEDISDDTRDWDVATKSAPQEEAPLAQDAEQQGEETGFAAGATSQESPLKAEGEESVAGSTDRTSQPRPVSDQHQLSEEMKQLLKELERESKQ